MRQHPMRRLFEFGGYAAAVILIAFGIAALVLGINGYRTVGDELSKEYIVGGSDMAPNEIQAAAKEAGLPATIELPTCDVVDEEIDTGTEARCFAQYMRIHALESSGGLTYAQMGRFLSADKPDDPAGTSDEAAALLDEQGNPVPNAARNTWVTETALATALNVSYMAQQISIFGLVVAIALILAGIGFGVLAFAALRWLRHRRRGARQAVEPSVGEYGGSRRSIDPLTGAHANPPSSCSESW